MAGQMVNIMELVLFKYLANLRRGRFFLFGTIPFDKPVWDKGGKSVISTPELNSNVEVPFALVTSDCHIVRTRMHDFNEWLEYLHRSAYNLTQSIKPFAIIFLAWGTINQGEH